MHIVVTMEVTQTHIQQLQEAAPGQTIQFLTDLDSSASRAALQEADVVIGNVPTSLLADMPKLQWLQLNSAGANQYCEPGVLRPDVQLTNATGAYGVAIAEHMVGVLLAMMKKLYRYDHNQQDRRWHDEGHVQSIAGATAVIVGYGDIGSHLGRLLKAFGAAKVIGVRRRHGDVPPEVDDMVTMDELDAVLPQADIVTASLPETAATYHAFAEDRFRRMKDGAFFINVGRGTSVDQEALVRVMKEGKLGGVSLDVTDPEPLPADHPLWTTPGVYLTPHVSGGYHATVTHDTIVAIAARNLRHFLAGEELENIVDKTTGYKK